MNNARGIYQPLADKVPIYDLADEDPEEERSRAPLLVVIALVVLAAFAGVVWLAYNQGVERGRQGASLVITAPAGPVRVAPPETAAPQFTDLNVYNDPVSPEQEAKASKLASQSPRSTEVPPIRLSPAVPAPAPAAPARPAAVAAPPPPAAQAAKAPPPAAAPVQTAQAAKAPPPPPAPPAQTAQAAKAPPPPSQTAQAKAAPAAVAQAAKAPPPPAAASAAASRAVSGTAVLQLGAFESQELANGAWAAFRARYPSVSGLSPDVQRADLGAKGVVYRLRVGPFADRTAATDACVQLKAAGANCFVSAP